MRHFLLCMLLLPLASVAQKRSEPFDSALYYRQQLYQLERRVMDSMRVSPEYLHLADRVRNTEGLSPDFTAVTFFVDVAGADYDALNASIEQSGFKRFPNTAVRLGYGVGYQFDRIVFDMAFFAIGLRNHALKTGEKISTAFSGFFQTDLGYDLLPAKWINLYPYAGLSYRTSLLTYKKAVQFNNSFTDVTNIVVSSQNVRERSNKVGYQAGLGLDVVVSERRNQGWGVMLFVKAGTARTFGKELYNIEGVEYKPGIQYGNWITTFGLKLFDRQ